MANGNGIEGGLVEEPKEHSVLKFTERLEDVLLNFLYKCTSVKNWAYAFCCIFTVLGVMHKPESTDIWINTWKWITSFYFGANVVQKFIDPVKAAVTKKPEGTNGTATGTPDRD